MQKEIRKIKKLMLQKQRKKMKKKNEKYIETIIIYEVANFIKVKTYIITE
jgi:hypothetical protein